MHHNDKQKFFLPFDSFVCAANTEVSDTLPSNSVPVRILPSIGQTFFSCSCSSLSLSLSLYLYSSLAPSVYGEFMIYPGQCRGQGHREQWSILLLLMCQKPHLLYSSLACADKPGLTNPPGVATFPPLPFFRKWTDLRRIVCRQTVYELREKCCTGEMWYPSKGIRDFMNRPFLSSRY